MLRRAMGLSALLAAFAWTPVCAAVDATATSVDALRDVSQGPKPNIFLRANQVVFLPGDSIEVTVDISPNGHTTPKTFFFYLENQTAGERFYINNVNGLLPAGQVTDVAGNPVGNPLAVPIPTADDLVLLGPGGVFGPAIQATADLVANHQFVLELRDVTGSRVFARANFQFAIVNQVVPVTANVASDTTWVSTNAYLLDDIAVFVQSGATLTIEPGTYVLGQNLGTLIVAQGGRIMACGTPARPIVMTSAQPVGERQRADWGGLILNGRAPVNIPGGTGLGEGDTGEFGGNDPNDSSGKLQYVRVEFAGFEFSPDNELNGIAFQGVGAGTEVDHIQVHYNLDDGVEMFGGTVNAKYLLLTGDADDSLDWTDGWIGLVQFVVAQQRGDDADQGIEADNSAENNNLLPRAYPLIYNFTLVGAPGFQEGSESDTGMLIREGTAGGFYNGIVTGFKEDAVDVDQSATFGQIMAGNLTLANSIFWNNGSGLDAAACGAGSVASGGNIFGCDDVANAESAMTTTQWVTAPAARNRLMNPNLRDPYNTVSPDFRPEIGSRARDLNFVKVPPDRVTLSDGRVVSGFFDTTVTYVGGVDPLNDWTQGWTYFGPF